MPPQGFNELSILSPELPVPRTPQAADSGERVIDLLAVWAREMVDERARREAEGLLFGLRQSGIDSRRR